jgi:hypothetical protein
MTPAEQLQWARHLLDHGGAATAGVWPRASALLARHALEQLLEEFWSPIAPSLVATRNVRAQLIALRGYAPVSASASPVSAAYAGLCRGCHHHPYELPPTRAELDWLIGTVERFAGTVGQATAPPAPAGKAPDKPLAKRR